MGRENSFLGSEKADEQDQAMLSRYDTLDTQTAACSRLTIVQFSPIGHRKLLEEYRPVLLYMV